MVNPRPKAAMPHYKCVTCTIRLTAAGESPGSCESCGSVLEPVTELSELVGYRLEQPHGDVNFAAAVAIALRGDITPTP
jgi:hypothetical protein